MYHGLKPIVKDKRDRSFHRTFGGVAPMSLPDEFNVDAGLTMPDQVADGLFEGCTAYAQQDLITDQDQVVYDHYRDHYMKTLQLEGAPFGSGCDIRDSLKVAIDFYGRGAYYAVESSKFDWFDSIRSIIYTNYQGNHVKSAVSIGTPWVKEFDITSVNSTGLVPDFFIYSPKTDSWHNWKISGWKQINGQTYLLGKTWQGKGYGDAGWAYFSRTTINSLLSIKGTGAYTLAPRDASNVQTVKLTMMESLIVYLQNLLALLSKKKDMTPTDPKLYTVAFSLIGQHLSLDDTVPASFGCAEAVSEVLKTCGYDMPEKGYASTVSLSNWLNQHAKIVTTPQVGDIIMSITQGNNHGHVGVIGHNAIMSNDSQTGLWEPYWSLKAWEEFYTKQKGLITVFYRLS